MENQVIAVLCVAGATLGTVIVYVHKFKVTLRKEIVDPEIKLLKENILHQTDIVKEQQISQDARICKVEKRIEELEASQEEKFDAILDKLSEIADKNSNLAGKMELLLDRFIKN